MLTTQQHDFSRDNSIREGVASGAEPSTNDWLGLPAAAWSRIAVLFVALVAIKTALLLVLNKHLFEVHWRVDAPEIFWGDYVALGAFVCLGVLNLAVLARQCRSIGIQAVRAANATIIGLGLLFIFLTFHEVDKNYLFPVLTGTLGWLDLAPYLSLDLFFRPPFLAAWLFGYALVYYALARTKRESWTLHLTTICAAAYGLLCLRGLAAHRNELFIADCLGFGAFMAARKPGLKVPLVWLLLPAAWTIFFAGELLHLSPVKSGIALEYFLGLLGASILLFGGATLLARRRGFLAAWGPQAFFYFASFFLLANANYPVAVNFNRTLCLGIEFPHYFGGELLLAGGLALGAMGWCKCFPQARIWWLDVVNLAAITVAFVDLRLAQIMGVRLEWGVLALGNQPKMMWRMARPYLPGAILGLGLAALGYALALRVMRHWQRRQASAPANFSHRGLWYFGVTSVLLGALGLVVANPDRAEGQAGLRLVQTSPWWKRAATRTLGRDQFLATAQSLGLGEFALARTVPQNRPRRDLNVVLVFMESTYNQHLSLFGSSEETEPLLSKYKGRMELYPNFFSNFASSIHARFAAFTSLYPAQDYNTFTLERVGVKSVFEVMRDNGYSCSLFYSSFFDFTGFRDFLSRRGLDEMYDADTMPGKRTTEQVSWGLREEETLGAIRSQIKKYAEGDRRFFLTYVPAAPHYPYEKVPPAFHKFNAGEMGDYTPFYLNDLLYMDWVIASIVDQLKDSGLLERTLVVITDDHGEMLGANKGPIGHGWLLTPELANAPLIIMDPQKPGYRVNQSVGSQVDLLPTLLDRLGIPIPQDQLYEGSSLDAGERSSQHLSYLNTFQQYAVLSGNRIIMGDRLEDAARPTGSGRMAYEISNEGSRTLFKAEPLAAEEAISMRKFDEFQANLLRNYSFYCKSVLGTSRESQLTSAK